MYVFEVPEPSVGAYMRIFGRFLITGILAVLIFAGCGGGGSSFSILPDGQIFKQSDGLFNNQLDILFVVDNSLSMDDEQQNLKTSFSAFIDDFIAKNYDFQIAVTATDAYLANQAELGGWYHPNNVDNIVGKFRDRQINTYHGDLRTIASIHPNPQPYPTPPNPTNTFVILPNTPNLKDVFGDNVIQGTQGYGDERAFSSFMTALNSPSNVGFLRPGAFLAIVIVSDEDDFSSWQKQPGTFNQKYTWTNGGTSYAVDTIQSYVDALDTLTNSTGALRRYNVSNISYSDLTSGSGCFSPGAYMTNYKNANGGRNRYMQLTEATDGVTGRICDADFSAALNDIQSKIAELSTQFFLDREPVLGSILVQVNGITIAESASNGWTYNATANSIVFHGASIPSQGSTIVVNFQPTTIK